jgi:hypothetical protein
MLFTFIPALLIATPAAAWGTLGHSTVGTVAQHFLEPATAKWVDGLLNDTLVSGLASPGLDLILNGSGH